MMEQNPAIVLLTDFGIKDGYAGIMKGVIHKLHPRARIIDLSHEIEPQNIDAAAFVLWQSYKYFPEGTIFVVVIDPDVGTSRKIVCLKSRQYLFLAPDNGVLKHVLSDLRRFTAVEVVNERLFLRDVSTTFHGRDVFAPVAASLSKGLQLRKLGPPLRIERKQRSFIGLDLSKSSDQVGSVVYVDRFGNVITNFLLRGKMRTDRRIKLQTHRKTVTHFTPTFGEATGRKPFCYPDSSGLLAVAVARGNASAVLRAKFGTAVRLKVSG